MAVKYDVTVKGVYSAGVGGFYTDGFSREEFLAETDHALPIDFIKANEWTEQYRQRIEAGNVDSAEYRYYWRNEASLAGLQFYIQRITGQTISTIGQAQQLYRQVSAQCQTATPGSHADAACRNLSFLLRTLRMRLGSGQTFTSSSSRPSSAGPVGARITTGGGPVVGDEVKPMPASPAVVNRMIQGATRQIADLAEKGDPLAIALINNWNGLINANNAGGTRLPLPSARDHRLSAAQADASVVVDQGRFRQFFSALFDADEVEQVDPVKLKQWREGQAYIDPAMVPGMIEELRIIGGRSGVFAFETLSWLQNFFTLALMNLHKEMPSTTNEKVAQATAMSDLLQYIQLTGAAMQWLYMTDGKVQADVNYGMDELWESLSDMAEGLWEYRQAIVDARYRYDFVKKMLQGIQSHIESTYIYVGKSTTELIESSDRYDESDRNLLYYSKLFPGLVTKFFDDGISGYDQATGRPLNTFQAVQSIFSGVSTYTGVISFMVSAPYMAASTLNFVSRTMPGEYRNALDGTGRYSVLADGEVDYLEGDFSDKRKGGYRYEETKLSSKKIKIYKEMGRLLSRKERNALIKQARADGINVVTSNAMLRKLNKEQGAGGRSIAFVADGDQGTIYLPRSFTYYEYFHERMHAQQFIELGRSQQAYKAVGRFKREEYVFNKIKELHEERPDLINKAEFEDAKAYMDDLLDRYNIGLID